MPEQIKVSQIIALDDDYELVIFSDQSIEIRDEKLSVQLGEEASYRLMSALQSVFSEIERGHYTQNLRDYPPPEVSAIERLSWGL